MSVSQSVSLSVCMYVCIFLAERLESHGPDQKMPSLATTRSDYVYTMKQFKTVFE